MARVLVSPAAVDDLERLIESHSLPGDTRSRVRRSIEPLADLPLLGASLKGRWQSYRFILGPWRWMLIVYTYDRGADTVAIATIQDGRSAHAPTAST